jgi:hypothetical protein
VFEAIYIFYKFNVFNVFIKLYFYSLLGLFLGYKIILYAINLVGNTVSLFFKTVNEKSEFNFYKIFVF